MTALMNPALDPNLDPTLGPARHRDRSPAPAEAVGVYRRRRVLAAVLMAVLTYGAWSLAIDMGDRLFTGEAGAGPVPASADVWVVQPGDTLWSIAAELGGEPDVRARVDALAAANGGPVLQVGQRLVVPAG